MRLFGRHILSNFKAVCYKNPKIFFLPQDFAMKPFKNTQFSDEHYQLMIDHLKAMEAYMIKVNIDQDTPDNGRSSLYTNVIKPVIPAWIHVRLSCLMLFGSMQIRSQRICAGIQATDVHKLPSLTTSLRTGPGYPLPGGYPGVVEVCV